MEDYGVKGLMLETPLLVSSLIEHAALYHGEREIVSRSVEGPIHRTTYAEVEGRAKQLVRALERLGVGHGDRVATLAWNGHRHLELYYALSGMGAVLHTLNPRLFPEQLAYIINHAEDKYLFLDATFVPLAEALVVQLSTVRGFVMMTDEASLPETTLPNVMAYETLVAAESDDYGWPQFDERTASSMCYTSGTTGHPKGVVYSHRSTVLHSMTACQTDVLGLSCRDSILPVVPMFHVNAWGIPYAAALVGAKLVFPGPRLDGAGLHELIEAEAVTFTAGVPTIWLMLLAHLKETGGTLGRLERVVSGGSAVPRSMIQTFEEDYGVRIIHAWGMTEMSPLGAVGAFKPGMAELPATERYGIQEKQGRTIYGVEMKIVDDDDKALPRDGQAFGNLKVRGPWVCRSYYQGKSDAEEAFDGDGWFNTGDVSTLDGQGFMQIVDRTKDVIKSGGEWISSIAIENIAVGHPEVAEACVIGIPHPKWDERPLLLIVRAKASSLDRATMLDYFEGKIVKWWLPDDVVFVDELPHTGTGKLIKAQLRETYKDHVVPTAAA